MGALVGVVLTINLPGEWFGLMFSEGALKIYNSPREDKLRIGAGFRHHCFANPSATPPEPIGREKCGLSSRNALLTVIVLSEIQIRNCSR